MRGSCAWQGGGGPDAVASDTCYANGVTVHRYGGWNGTNVTGELTVSRRGALCYTIESISGMVSSATTHVISGPNSEVATAVTADKADSIAVTCPGHGPVLVNFACLDPVSTDTADCTLDACP